MLTTATGEETLTPNPNKCSSTLMSETRGIYPHRYILMLMSGVTAYVFPRAAAPLRFVIVLFCLQKTTTKNKKKTIVIFEFFILSGKNDKQLIQYLLFRL